MLHQWFKFFDHPTSTMDDNLTRHSDVAAKWQQTTSMNALNNAAETAVTNDSLSPPPPPPPNTPFRKKAITCIERTRKLSILLRQQRYLVSFDSFPCCLYFTKLLFIFQIIVELDLKFVHMTCSGFAYFRLISISIVIIFGLWARIAVRVEHFSNCDRFKCI